MKILRTFYLSLVALLGLCGAVAIGNYAMTQGAGTNFGSIVNGSSIHFAQQLLCDLTTQSQCAAVSAAGAVKVDGSAVTQPVSGTVTSNVGTGTRAISIASGQVASGAFAAGSMVDLLTMRQTVAGGTVASNSLLAGGIYNSTPITMTNGQGAAMQFDANGYLKVNTAAGAAAGGTSSNFGSAFPTPGTAIGFTDGTNMVSGRVGAVANVAAATNFMNTLGIAQYNATPLTVTDTRYQSLQSDVNGFLKVNVTNSNSNLTPGDGIATGTYTVGSPTLGGVLLFNGTSYDRARSGTTTGSALINGAGTAGSAAGGVVTVQGVASMTPFLSNPGTAANWGIGATGAAPPANGVQIMANTSGATGGLQQGLIQCDSSAIYDASTSGSTELVALTSGRTIYVCGYSIIAGGTVNVKLVYGTGTNCATSPSNITPAYQLTAQAGISDGAAFFRGLKTASANALCINASGAVAAQAIVYYAKL